MSVEFRKDPVKRIVRIIGLVAVVLVFTLVGTVVAVAILHPELVKALSHEQRTARLVTERMREESQDSDGKQKSFEWISI